MPAYSLNVNADEAIWGWAREEVTANTCLGTKAKVQEKLAQFFAGLAERAEEVKRRCRTELQAAVEALESPTTETVHANTHGGLICASV